MAKSKYNFIVLSDIHFGIKDSQKLYEELDNVFLPYIEEKPITNGVIVLPGDTFDKKLSLNEDASHLSIKFMEKLVDISVKNNYKIRVILGTKTHELSQLNIFDIYTTRNDVDFKIIRTVRSEKLFEELDILYLPEEYVEDYKTYYADFFKKKYDFIFGHGTMSFSAFKNQKILSERPIKSAVVFDSAEISKLVKHYAIFGHIHVHKKYKNIILPGSFTRWVHGEENEKGFLHVKLINGKSTFNFITNPEAPLYKTIDIDEIDGDTLEVKLKNIKKMKKNGINIALKLNESTSLEEVEIIKDTFKEDDSFKIRNDASLIDIDDEEENNEYSFLQNDKLDIETKIRKFIIKKYGVKIKKDFIIENITSEKITSEKDIDDNEV